MFFRFSSVSAFVFFLTSAFSAFAQAPVSAQAPLVAPPHPSFLTDALVFRFLFKHVVLVGDTQTSCLRRERMTRPCATTSKKLRS